ncbi:EAL domain-containing protein [Stagnimonas aquatica]|uniref:EAL domain-containing protein n=1 Tax=Stagnimonas aquatica TaxID=2689987 RepID=A0A3N0VAG1_9GAMM|nr:EAL domain-containing protein [Stagnimonas aquatica]ROH89679.1 EAL domain-containing protein [Stagnimonas aquatica]
MSHAQVPSALSVLLVEDSPFDSRLLIEALRPATLSGEVVVQTVKRLSLAVAELQRVSFSCVLLDLGLPDGQGVDNVRALREVDNSAAIVVLTGLDDERSATQALQLGAQDYLLKGEIDGERLLKLIRRAVQRNRQTVELEQQLDGSFFQASRDPLTLLPNRPLLLDRARLQLAEARQRDGEFGFACLLLDGLDAARGQYGAVVGDELTRRLAELMAESLRGSDTLARLDQEQFALLVYPLPEPGALIVAAQQLIQRVEALQQIGHCAVQLRLRIGLAVFAGGTESAEELLERARGLAASLPAGRSGLAGLEASEPASATAPALTADAPTVLDGRWQPWVDTETGLCAGLELLPPWPVGAAAPADGAQAVELVLACAHYLGRSWREWAAAGFQAERLALNLPAACLRQRDFPARLQAVLAVYGLPPSQLQLEVEELALRNPLPHRETLLALHALGYGLVLDGDGGDTSLSQLSQIPLAGLKLSRGLLRNLMDDQLQGSSRRYLNALLGAARGLGIAVIATGVDSAETLSALRVIGLRWMQGERLVAPLEAHLVPVQWPRPVRLA